MSSREPVLSVCMIVKNEAHQLAEALENFQAFADEIVVVDTGSTDGTADVARRFTPQVFDFMWCDDFSAARNQSLSHARGSHVLWMDADDRVEPNMVERINQLKGVFDGRTAYYFILQDMNRSGPSCSFYQLRCVPRKDDVKFVGRIHEQLTLGDLAPLTVEIVIHHHGYLHKGIHRSKLERNLALLKKERDDGRDDAFIHYYLSLTSESLDQMSESVEHMQQALTHLEREARRNQGPVAKKMAMRALMEAHFQMARLHRKAGSEALALRHVTRAQALAGDDASSQYCLGLLYQECGRPRMALGCIEKAFAAEAVLSLFPSAPLPTRDKLLVHMAFSHLRLKEYALATQRIKDAEAMGLNPVEAWELLGYLALNQKEWTIALHAYEAASRVGELSPVGFYFLGFLYQQRKLADKALECYRRTLDKDPDHENARRGLESVLLELARPSEASRLHASHG